MPNQRWTNSRTSIYNLSYHIIWCTKYRRKVLTDVIQERMKQLLEEKCTSMNITIKAMETMPEHIHIFISSQPIYAPHYIVQQLKGYLSRMLRQEFPELKSRLPSLWTRSYYIDSVGVLNEYTIKHYVENQKNK